MSFYFFTKVKLKFVYYNAIIGGDRLKFRHEYKHKINNLDIMMIRQRLKAIAKYDENSKDNGTYFIRLEKKSKFNRLCVKESTVMTQDQIRKIIDNDIDFLKESCIPLFQELYAKMNYQMLRLKNIVAYERKCFVYGPGNVRVPLDTNVRDSYNIQTFLESDVHMTHLYHTSILEVKWDEYMPQIIRDAVQLRNRQSSSFLKYAAVRF